MSKLLAGIIAALLVGVGVAAVPVTRRSMVTHSERLPSSSRPRARSTYDPGTDGLTCQTKAHCV